MLKAAINVTASVVTVVDELTEKLLADIRNVNAEGAKDYTTMNGFGDPTSDSRNRDQLSRTFHLFL